MGLRQTRGQGSGENYIMRSLMINTAYHTSFGLSIWKNEMGGACGMYGAEKRCVQV